MTKMRKIAKAVSLSEPPVPGRTRSFEEDLQWLRFRASITACLWHAIAESDFTVDDLAADTGIPADKITQMLSGNHEDSTTAELAALFYIMGFKATATLSPPEAVIE